MATASPNDPLPTDACRPARGPTVSLNQLKPGETATVHSSSMDPDDAALLRAMGLRLNATIKMCRAGEPCIISVQGPHGCACRIGLARPLAERVQVDVIQK
jgi:Fe2+ transport system protein FeoA